MDKISLPVFCHANCIRIITDNDNNILNPYRTYKICFNDKITVKKIIDMILEESMRYVIKPNVIIDKSFYNDVNMEIKFGFEKAQNYNYKNDANKKIHFDWEFTENKHIKNMFRINNHHNFQNSNKFSKYFK